MRKSIQCIDCEKPRDDEFKGNRCGDCWKAYSAAYYQSNKKRLHELRKANTIKRLAALPPKPPKPPKPVKVKPTEEEKAIKRKEYYNNVTLVRNLCRERKQLSIRKPVKKNPDRELYCSNEIFPTITYYMDFSELRDIPMERLDYDYWLKRDYVKEEEIQLIKEESSPTEKKCFKCENVKPLADFGIDRQRLDGRRSYCRECIKKYNSYVKKAKKVSP